MDLLGPQPAMAPLTLTLPTMTHTGVRWTSGSTSNSLWTRARAVCSSDPFTEMKDRGQPGQNRQGVSVWQMLP